MIYNCEIIRDMLKAALGNKVKSYWIGEPKSFAESSLPIITVSPGVESITIADNQRDNRTSTIEIGLHVSVKQNLDGNSGEMVGIREASDIMGGENDSENLKTNTVLYQIRHNLNLEGYSNRYIENEIAIDYSRDSRTEGQDAIKSIVMTIPIFRIANR